MQVTLSGHKRSVRYAKLVGFFVVATMLILGSRLVFAAETPGTGPEAALTVPSGTITIPAGGELWFAFNYIGDGSQIVVDLAGNPQSTTFTIWTPGNVRNRSLNQVVTPVGAGAVNTYTGNPDQVWVGSFVAKGTFYVVVDQNALSGSTFQLKVTGSGVYDAGEPMTSASASPTPTVTASATEIPIATWIALAASMPIPTWIAPATATPMPTIAAATPATNTAPSGSSPATARSAPSGWITTVAGTSTWYAFQYAGDKSQIVIDMQVYPANAASFTVWTPQSFPTGQLGQVAIPVGAGSPKAIPDNPNALACRPGAGFGFFPCRPNLGNANDLIWSGSFNFPGTYYVIVDQSGLPGGYNLTITGTGVAAGF